ncbi:MAG: hypothetical protein EBR82_24245 [Caulobacteraceae bacterium]|nr:hypothetical protein [Caulobacteraceae bacterium]
MAVALTYAANLTAVETYSDTFVSSSDNTVTFSGLNSSGTYNAGTGVPVTKVASYEVAMSAGAATINLRSLTGINGSTVDGNGLKAQFVKFKNKSTNANAITITEGASNGYELLGNAFTLVLKPGQEITMNLNEQAPDISDSAKTIDISGTSSQVLQIFVAMG